MDFPQIWNKNRHEQKIFTKASETFYIVAT